VSGGEIFFAGKIVDTHSHARNSEEQDRSERFFTVFHVSVFILLRFKATATMMILNDGSLTPLTITATVVTVVASIFITSKCKPITRSMQTLWSRLNLQRLLLMKSSQKMDDNNNENSTVVTSLYKYPVKSLRTIPCDEAVIDTKGFAGDRRFMLVTPAPVPLWGSFGPDDATHRFLTQRQCPSLARVVVQTISSDGKNELQFSSDLVPNQTCTISVEPDSKAQVYRSTLWGDIVTVQDMGDAAAAYLQSIVSMDENVAEEMKKDCSVRLVVQYAKDNRTANDKFVPPVARSVLGKNPSVHLGDGFPMYVAYFSP
jgi:MOSC N-terminal beta barrel domain